MAISFTISNDDANGVVVRSFVNGILVGEKTGNSQNTYTGFYLTMHGPYSNNPDSENYQGYGEAFATMDNFTIKVMPKAGN